MTAIFECFRIWQKIKRVLTGSTFVRVLIVSRVVRVLTGGTVVRVVIVSRIVRVVTCRFVYDPTNGWIIHDRRPEIIV